MLGKLGSRVRDIIVTGTFTQKLNALFRYETSPGVYGQFTTSDWQSLGNKINFEYGVTLYVDSVNGTAGWPGTKLKPMTSIDTANNAAVALEYTTIYVEPGHTEAISGAAGIDLDIANVRVIGHGVGSTQSAVTFTDAASTWAINAANVQVYGMHLQATVTVVAKGFDIEDGADDFRICGNRFSAETLGTDEFNDSIFVTTADRGVITDNYIDMDEAAAQSGIHMVGICLGSYIARNDIRGDYAVGCIENATTAVEDVNIEWNRLYNGVHANLNAIACISMQTGSTGSITNNKCYTDVADPATGAIVSAGCFIGDSNEIITIAEAPAIKRMTGGQVFSGTNSAASTTAPVVAELHGFGEDFFNNEYFMYCVQDAGGANAAPEGEYRLITNYVTATGTFTVNAFGTALADTDEVIVIHKDLVNDPNALSYTGSNTAASTTTPVVDKLAGFGNDHFNDQWSMVVIKDAAAGNALPEGEVRQITDYVSATGTFTVSAFGTALADGDVVAVVHSSQLAGYSNNTILGTLVSKTGFVPTATGDLFTVTGKNLVNLMHGEMTTVEAGSTTSLTLALNMKANSVDIAAATAIYQDAVNTLYMITGDQDDLFNGGDAPTQDHAHVAEPNFAPFIIDGDVIEGTIVIGGGTSTGAMSWHIHYVPLEAGASIVAA